MRKEKSFLLTLAKSINQEILIEELFHSKGIKEENILSKYRRKKRIIKIKILFTKIFYSIIFGILPVIPLFTYFEIQNQFINDGLNLSIVIFGSNLLYSFFFIMQFLNIIFMGMIEISLILSKNLFFWLETLPISAKSLKKLKILTIFHSFDIPIIIITFAFPTVILIGTFNILLFFMSLGLSILQVIFSFNVLILLGNRLNKSLDINISSRKTLIIRLVNIFGFLILFFGSLFFVQWAITSIDTFFTFSLVQEHPAYVNLVLCTIPYPFSPSYFISFFSITNQIHIHYWIGLVCGLGLFIIFNYWLSRKSLKILDTAISSKRDSLIKYAEKKEFFKIEINVKITKPVLAYFLKDFKIIIRNLKAFLSVITPIIISFVFTYTFNFTVLGVQPSYTTEVFYNWSVILAFQPVICGMIIYNLINIEKGGESILVSLPISPKDQAKSKLYYFLVIQTIAIIGPYLIYIFESNFVDLFISIIISLPFSWIILISMFELYIYSFGRKKYRFVLEPVNPKNQFSKWAFIYLAEYCFYIFIVSLGMVLNYKRELFYLINFIVDIFVCLGLVYIMFKSMFAPVLKPKKVKPKLRELNKIDLKSLKTEIYLKKVKFSKYKSLFFIKQPWISISIVLISNFLFVLSINLYIFFLFQLIFFINYTVIFWLFVVPNLICIFIRIRFIPRGSYKKSKKAYKIIKFVIYGIIGAVIVIALHFFFVFVFSIPYPAHYYQYFLYYLGLNTYKFLIIITYVLWYEILFRGIILPILLSKYRKPIAAILNTCIFFLYNLTSIIFFYIWYGTMVSQIFFIIFMILIYTLIINGTLSVLSIWQKNIYSGIITHIITIFFGILPYFYSGLFLLFPFFS
ncbi:MAG: hypothetical protein ACFE9Z_13540 [Promethearchaeota archaeon]